VLLRLVSLIAARHSHVVTPDDLGHLESLARGSGRGHLPVSAEMTPLGSSDGNAAAQPVSE
jgi:hypothetical protein